MTCLFSYEWNRIFGYEKNRIHGTTKNNKAYRK